jgi:hypothetical protein
VPPQNNANDGAPPPVRFPWHCHRAIGAITRVIATLIQVSRPEGGHFDLAAIYRCSHGMLTSARDLEWSLVDGYQRTNCQALTFTACCHPMASFLASFGPTGYQYTVKSICTIKSDHDFIAFMRTRHHLVRLKIKTVF